jgi:hypothetical protein
MGTEVGGGVGSFVGNGIGVEVGFDDGGFEGTEVGLEVGCDDGGLVGIRVGFEVGWNDTVGGRLGVLLDESTSAQHRALKSSFSSLHCEYQEKTVDARAER